MTPYAALLDRIRSDPASPLLTYRDLGTTERMELSATSLGNAVAKTAGLLRNDLDVTPGDIVAVYLPIHWQRIVWLGACAAIGAIFAPTAEPASAAVAVVDADTLDLLGMAREDVVVSLAPFGLPEPQGVPAGVTEAAVAMRAHPDTFIPEQPEDEDAPLLLQGDRTMSGGDIMREAQRLLTQRNIGPHSRFAVFGPDPDVDVLGLAGPLINGGSVVLVTGDGDMNAALADEGVMSPPAD